MDFLLRRGSETGTLVHLGDLFNIWLGRSRFEMEHMAPVLEAFRKLRMRGVRTILAEGNRDFHVRACHEGDAFDEVAERSVDVAAGPVQVRVAHGDLVNTADRQYRAWRAFAKSAAVGAAVCLLPSRAGLRLAERLEVRLRGTNVRHKSYFPEEAARRFAASAFREGCSLAVVGHFHEERVVEAPGGGVVVVVPDWRSSRAYLRVRSDGTWALERWRPPDAEAPGKAPG